MMITGSRVALLHGAEQVDAAAARHADIAHQHLRRIVFQRLEHLARAGEAAHAEALALQRLFQHESNGLVVVDDPDGFHAGSWSIKAVG